MAAVASDFDLWCVFLLGVEPLGDVRGLVEEPVIVALTGDLKTNKSTLSLTDNLFGEIITTIINNCIAIIQICCKCYKLKRKKVHI